MVAPLDRGPARRRRAAGLPSVVLALLALWALTAPGAALAAVPAGSYCVVGLGPTTAGAADGWLATVTPAGVVTARALPTALINPWDCAIDPTTGDIIVVDEGNTGAATDGRLFRVAINGATVTQTTLVNGAPLVNPRGVAVATDGTIYVADVGATFNTNDNNGAIFAISFPGGVTTVNRLTAVGDGNVDSPVDLDIDPRPFGAPSAGVNVVYLERTGQIRRVPITLPGPNTTQNVSATPAGNNWEGIEVGPYGNYFIVNDSAPDVQRYDRLSNSFTQVLALAGSATPRGITVDYFTGDLVIADSDAAATGGVVNVPPNSYLAGAPARTVIAAPGALPGTNAAGVGFSPPLESTSPSSNFGVPTRRAPIPGEAFALLGPTYSTDGGEPEDELNLFIEVTDTSSPLMIRIFDPNVRDGYDVPLTGAFDTPVRYTLYDPAGTQLTQVTIAGNGSVDLDQRIATLNSGNTLTVRGAGVALAANRQGLYRLLIELTASNDWQGFGVWVDRFNTYTYNFATGTSATTGAAPLLIPQSPFRMYPYLERGCEFTTSIFDGDSVAGTAIPIESRLGQAFTTTMSGNGVHAETTIAPTPGGSPRSNVETDYGLYTMEGTTAPNLTEFNIITYRAPDFQGWTDAGGTGVPLPAPRGNTPADPTPSLRTSPGPAYPQAFSATSNNFVRHYLPRYDEAPTQEVSPYAPYVMHSATPITGDPPAVGVPARYVVLATVVNPDPVNAMTNVTLTSPVPAPTLYVDSGTGVTSGASATGGGSVTTCAAPCSGTITTTWATIPAGSAATLSYAVQVTATSAGQRLYLTGGPPLRGGGATPAANTAPTPGTSATFSPAWSSAAFARTESLGPLCDLSVLQGTVSPVAVSLASFEASAGDGEALLVWETASEFENLGFHVWRRLEGELEFSRVTPSLILGRGTTDLAARYAWRDLGLPNGVRAEWLLEDVELDGRSAWHGPVSATPEAGARAVPLDPAEHALLGTAVPLPGSGVEPTPVETAASPALPPPATGGSPAIDAGDARVIARDASGVWVEVRIPGVQETPISVDGAAFTRVAIPGWDHTLAPGLPELPERTFWLEAPAAAAYALHVVERDGAVRSLSAPVVPVPATTLEGDTVTALDPAADPALSPDSAPWPRVAAEVAGSAADGAGSRLLALRVHPARIATAATALDVDSRLLLRIDGAPAAQRLTAAPETAGASATASVAALPALALGVRGRGLVRITGAELVAAGLDPATDPRTLQLYRRGTPVPARIDGESDGVLGPADALIFHADGLDTRYSDEETFFLAPVAGAPARAPALPAAPVGPAGPATVAATGRAEPQSTYLPGILNGEGDNFVGPYVFDRAVATAVATPGAVAGPATLRVRLRGGTTYADLPADHHFGVRVAGTDVLDARFDGSDAYDQTVSLPPGLVVDGDTAVEIVPRFDSGAPFDLVYLDSLEIGYRRATSLRPADAGRLELVADASGTMVVTGVSGTDTRVWNISDPGAPFELANATRAAGLLSFQANAGARYAISDPSGLRAASSLRPNAPSSWSTAGGADWVAIAPAAFLPALAPLAAQREADGLEIALVDVQDVYDEMSGGDFTPVAIRDFVRTIAARWNPAPRYVLLVGDATYDYRNFLHGAAVNAVPTMLVDTTFVEAASDSWFGTLDDADLAPDVAVGRIPARNAAELAGIVAKLVGYESLARAPGALEAPWRSRALLVADDGLGAGNDVEAEQFESVLETWRRALPPDFAHASVTLRELPEAGQGAAANAAILGALTDGVALAVYGGHGGAQLWADELIYGAGDVAAVANAPALPLFVVLDCLNAFFDAPNEDSLGEVALRAADRGAVAFVSSTTVSAFGGEEALSGALAQRLLGANVRRVGDALSQAMQSIAATAGAEDAIRSFVLLGDPATQLGVPLVPIADAGPDATTTRGAPIFLDGTGSAAPDGAPLTYAWRVASEPVPGAATLRQATTSQPVFVTVVPGSYTIELSVHDAHRASAPDAVHVLVTGDTSAWTCAGPGGAAPRQVSSVDGLYFLVPAVLARALRRAGRRRPEPDPDRDSER